MLSNGNPIGLGLQGKAIADESIPTITPEDAIKRRFKEEEDKQREKANAFNKELSELVTKHKPDNYVAVFSYYGEIEGKDGKDDFPIAVRINGTVLIGEPLANVGIAEMIMLDAKKRANVLPRPGMFGGLL